MIPAEFVQPDEFCGLTGSRQRAVWRRWLDRIGVRYVLTPAGYPLVYRQPGQPGDPRQRWRLTEMRALLPKNATTIRR